MAWFANLSSCHFQPVIETPLKGNMPTTNCLSPWKVHLYYKKDGDPCKISRTSASKLSSTAALARRCWWRFTLAHAYSLTGPDGLSQRGNPSGPARLHSLHNTVSTVLLEYTKLQLGCIGLLHVWLLLACMHSCSMVMHPTVHVHEAPASTEVSAVKCFLFILL